MKDNLNPDFQTNFTMKYFFEKQQLMRFVVYDDDGNVKCDLDSVMRKWKNEFENLYKTDSDSFDNVFYEQIKSLLHTHELNMTDPLYVSNLFLNRNIYP